MLSLQILKIILYENIKNQKFQCPGEEINYFTFLDPTIL